MDKVRQLVTLTVVAVLVVLLGGWFMLVSPQRSKASDLRDQTAAQQQSNAQLTTEIARLKAEARDLPAEQARLAAIAEKLPANPAMPALVHDLTKAAKKAGIDLQIIEPDTPTAFGVGKSVQITPPGQLAPGTAPTGTTPGSTTPGSTTPGSTTPGSTTSGSTTSGSTTSGSTSGSGSTAGSGAVTGAPGTTVPGQGLAPGLYQIPIKVTAVGSYYELAQFLHHIENLRRAYLVTELNAKPGDPLAASFGPAQGGAGHEGYDGTLTAEVTGFVFEVLTAPPAGATTTPSTTNG